MKKLRVYLRPAPHLSLAMFRIADVLARTAPPNVRIVTQESGADLLVLHVIGFDSLEYRTDLPCAVIQYCTRLGWQSDAEVGKAWAPLWNRAKLIWSYYDLTRMGLTERFYHAPLGVTDAFLEPFTEGPRPRGIITSGYVAGPGAEAIDEATLASARAGFPSVHLGPKPRGMSAEGLKHLRPTGLIPDGKLAELYRTCRYVSGLRFYEGFELPALEGLACGARPIMFDRPDDRRWFGEHAVFVPEKEGPELVDILASAISVDPVPVSEVERKHVAVKFNWDRIAHGFWDRVMEAV